MGSGMHARELPIPSIAEGDTSAVELLRVWAAHGGQHISLATNLWDDPAFWGIMLVDLAKHIASAYEQSGANDFLGALRRVREGFDAEWDTATDEPTGSMQE
jgi:uncharacterized protein DUF5076